jgi:hypothetical protein
MREMQGRLALDFFARFKIKLHAGAVGIMKE